MLKYLEQIITAVAEETGVTTEDIISPKRHEDISIARKLFVSFCYRYGISTSKIAEYLQRSNDGIRKLYLAFIKSKQRDVELDVERVIKDKLDSKLLPKKE